MFAAADNEGDTIAVTGKQSEEVASGVTERKCEWVDRYRLATAATRCS